MLLLLHLNIVVVITVVNVIVSADVIVADIIVMNCDSNSFYHHGEDFVVLVVCKCL